MFCNVWFGVLFVIKSLLPSFLPLILCLFGFKNNFSVHIEEEFYL